MRNDAYAPTNGDAPEKMSGKSGLSNLKHMQQLAIQEIRHVEQRNKNGKIQGSKVMNKIGHEKSIRLIRTMLITSRKSRKRPLGFKSVEQTSMINQKQEVTLQQRRILEGKGLNKGL